MLIATSDTFFKSNSEWITALAILAVTLVAAKVIDVLLVRSSRRIDGDAAGEPISQAAVTRLRLVRRLIVLGVILLGSFIALAQIEHLRTLGTALLASSAVIGVALGIAARAVVANAIAGMMLASVQPFRIGDVIEWQGERGRVKDITLSYTYLNLPSGHQLVIPNEQIATTPLENYTIGASVVDAEASVQVAPEFGLRALKLLREKLPDAIVQFGICEVDRVELIVAFSTTAGSEATERFATRELVVSILSDADILRSPAQAA